MKQLAADNQGLVYHVCRKHYRGYLPHDEDLIASGMVGLVRAAKRFRPELGYEFSTYAYQAIRNEIRRYLRDKNHPGGVKVPRDSGIKVACYSIQNPIKAGSEAAYEDALETEQDFTSVEVDEFMSTLSEREQELCQLVAAGLKQREVAERLGTTQASVSRWLGEVRRKYTEWGRAND